MQKKCGSLLAKMNHPFQVYHDGTLCSGLKLRFGTAQYAESKAMWIQVSLQGSNCYMQSSVGRFEIRRFCSVKGPALNTSAFFLARVKCNLRCTVGNCFPPTAGIVGKVRYLFGEKGCRRRWQEILRWTLQEQSEYWFGHFLLPVWLHRIFSLHSHE